jgi:hypothetical protein
MSTFPMSQKKGGTADPETEPGIAWMIRLVDIMSSRQHNPNPPWRTIHLLSLVWGRRRFLHPCRYFLWLLDKQSIGHAVIG